MRLTPPAGRLVFSGSSLYNKDKSNNKTILQEVLCYEAY